MIVVIIGICLARTSLATATSLLKLLLFIFYLIAIAAADLVRAHERDNQQDDTETRPRQAAPT